ncbi:MAG: hypothetical protein V1704_02410 [Candidatus Vogelbacteria bacterium]
MNKATTKYVILIVLVILGFAFYWYSLRPSIIKKDCYKEMLAPGRYESGVRLYNREDIDYYLKSCWQRNGL